MGKESGAHRDASARRASQITALKIDFAVHDFANPGFSSMILPSMVLSFLGSHRQPLQKNSAA
jgi:hypothetical protein